MFGQVGSIHDGNGVIGGKIDFQLGKIDEKTNACDNGPICDGHMPAMRNIQVDRKGNVAKFNSERMPCGLSISHVRRVGNV